MDLQEDGTEGDEDDPEENGAKNTPKEDLVLVLGRDTKKAEDHDEDEEVVDRQGLFDDEAGEELQGGVTGLPIRIESGQGHELRILREFMFAVDVEGEIEQQRQGDPEHAPTRSLPHPNGMGFPMKHPQVEGEDPKNKNQEARVEPDILAKRKKDNVNGHGLDASGRRVGMPSAEEMP